MKISLWVDEWVMEERQTNDNDSGKPSIHPFIHPLVHPSVPPSVLPPIRPSIRPSICPPNHLSIYSSVPPSIHLSNVIHLYYHPSIYLSKQGNVLKWIDRFLSLKYMNVIVFCVRSLPSSTVFFQILLRPKFSFLKNTQS